MRFTNKLLYNSLRLVFVGRLRGWRRRDWSVLIGIAVFGGRRHCCRWFDTAFRTLRLHGIHWIDLVHRVRLCCASSEAVGVMSRPPVRCCRGVISLFVIESTRRTAVFVIGVTAVRGTVAKGTRNVSSVGDGRPIQGIALLGRNGVRRRRVDVIGSRERLPFSATEQSLVSATESGGLVVAVDSGRGFGTGLGLIAIDVITDGARVGISLACLQSIISRRVFRSTEIVISIGIADRRGRVVRIER